MALIPSGIRFSALDGQTLRPIVTDRKDKVWRVLAATNWCKFHAHITNGTTSTNEKSFE